MNLSQGMIAMRNENTRRQYEQVWDPLVRLFHWLLVAGFVTAYVTQEKHLNLHVWSGYVVGALLIFRVVWGFIGPRYARFRNFLYSPRNVLGYIWDLLHLRTKRYLGHNPAGGAMIFALLLFLALTVGTGLMLYGQENHAGPLARLCSGAPTANVPALIVRDERHRNGELPETEAGESLEALHELFANITLALAIFHLFGVIVTSLEHRENLVLSMITGSKRSLDKHP